MENNENKPKFRREIEALSNISIKGKIFEETPDTIVIQTNHSLLEMHREDIANITKIQSDQETDLVSVSISKNADITEKRLTTAGQAAMPEAAGVATGPEGSIYYHEPPHNAILYRILVLTDTGVIPAYTTIPPNKWPKANEIVEIIA